MRYLIIPDIHLRWKIADDIIKKEKGNYDKVLFLGDYMDDFGAIKEDYIDTSKWIKDNIYDSNMIFLLGNHDIAYYSHMKMFQNETSMYGCSGYYNGFKEAISDILTLDEWRMFKLYYFIKDNILCTHAGFCNGLYESLNIENIKDYLTEEGKIALNRIETNFMPIPITMAGASRGGRNRYGGITWCDYYKDYKPIRGLSQIFGHTILHEPEYILYDGGVFTLALDTNSRDYAFYDDETNEVKIKKVTY